MRRHTTAKPFALGLLALGVAIAATPAARAGGSEGMGTQTLAETARRDALHGGASGWRNGMPTLVQMGGGSGYSIAYNGAVSGDAAMGTVTVASNADGNPVVEYDRGATGPRPALMAGR